MKSYDISKEMWREYKWVDPITGNFCSHRIENPKSLFYEKGHTTHRIVDSFNVAHCIPAVGYFGCIVFWKNIDESKPVNF